MYHYRIGKKSVSHSLQKNMIISTKFSTFMACTDELMNKKYAAGPSLSFPVSEKMSDSKQSRYSLIDNKNVRGNSLLAR